MIGRAEIIKAIASDSRQVGNIDLAAHARILASMAALWVEEGLKKPDLLVLTERGTSALEEGMYRDVSAYLLSHLWPDAVRAWSRGRKASLSVVPKPLPAKDIKTLIAAYDKAGMKRVREAIQSIAWGLASRCDRQTSRLAGMATGGAA